MIRKHYKGDTKEAQGLHSKEECFFIHQAVQDPSHVEYACYPLDCVGSLLALKPTLILQKHAWLIGCSKLSVCVSVGVVVYLYVLAL